MPEQRINPHHSALFTDLYELTMSQAYYAEEMTAPAVFELFFREMPENRNYVVAAGLDEVLDYLENLRFTAAELDWLKQYGQFSEAFLDKLENFRFSGDVHAVPEGTVVFENEPVFQVVAPLPEAQLIETFVLNQFHLQSVAATKAARVVTAAAGRRVVDFGSRRSHGIDAALKVARSSYMMGAAGTSNVAAGRLYDIPTFGTMAHSYIQAHPDELSAFTAFSREFPETTLLLDTYDTLGGMRKVVDLSRQLGENFKIRSVRLDSGNLAELAKQVRQGLDQAGLADIKIIASSSLNEYKIAKFIAAGVPIDGFGVGTELAVSSDMPEIDYSYKLVAYDGQPRMKLSSSKLVMPGRKQVYRNMGEGRMLYDMITPIDEAGEGEPLLIPVMQGGQRLDAGRVSLQQAREHAKAQLAALPEELKALEQMEQGYIVGASASLREMTENTKRQLAALTGAQR